MKFSPVFLFPLYQLCLDSVDRFSEVGQGWVHPWLGWVRSTDQKMQF